MTETIYSTIIHTVQAAITRLGEIEQLSLDTPAQLNEAERHADSLIYATSKFIEEIMPSGIEYELSGLLSLKLKDDYFYLRNPFDKHKELFIKEFPTRIRNFQALLELL